MQGLWRLPDGPEKLKKKLFLAKMKKNSITQESEE